MGGGILLVPGDGLRDPIGPWLLVEGSYWSLVMGGGILLVPGDGWRDLIGPW